MPQYEFDLLGELWNVSVNITLIQAIRDIPIYSKSIRELCLKKQGRKKKDPSTFCVIGDLVELVMGNTLATKYSDSVSHIVQVQINGISLSNTLIYLGVAINIMTKNTMERLCLTNIPQNTIVLQLVDQSLVRPGGIIEDVFILVD